MGWVSLVAEGGKESGGGQLGFGVKVCGQSVDTVLPQLAHFPGSSRISWNV